MLSKVFTSNKESQLQDIFSEIHNQLRVTYGQNIGFCVALLENNQTQIKIPYYYVDDLPVQIIPYVKSNDLLLKLLTPAKAYSSKTLLRITSLPSMPQANIYR